ncbi:hypothetical protein DH2020_045765 [Rehmannia glutinosa]|uniref:DUF4283 domain-containing protein n=1 Tax=Rehmannia glutinosa TaxID=99300 RepID=A0ABR0UDV5_REHGL
MFKRIWNPRHGLVCKPLGENTVLFQFSNLVDMKKVLNGSPWLFDKSLLALSEINALHIGSKLEVSSCPFWIQIHDLPIGLMNKSFAEATGNIVGKYLYVDAASDGSLIGRFLRVRVDLNITKPLRRIIKTSFRGSDYVLPIKYERLPNFCYHCGIIADTLTKIAKAASLILLLLSRALCTAPGYGPLHLITRSPNPETTVPLPTQLNPEPPP